MMPSSSLSLADWLGGSHHGEEVTYSSLATLEAAGPGDVSFLNTDRCTSDTESAAGLLLVKQPIPGRTCICVDDPKLAFIKLIEHVFPVEQTPGTSDAAHVDASAVVDATATLHAGVVVMGRCSVGAHTVLFPNVVLYPDTTVGAHCRIHAGAVIGADGFSYHPTAEGPRKVPQVGRVVIDDGVEIGANSTIDRAFMGETRVGAQTKIDNLVHVGHNCQIGSAVLMAAQSGLSGSVSVSDRVMIGGQAGVIEHVAIGTGARVGAQSGVVRSVDEGETVLGTPAEPAMKMKRIYAKLRAQASKPD